MPALGVALVSGCSGSVQRLFTAIPAKEKRLFLVSDQPGVHGWTPVEADPATGRRPLVPATLVTFLHAYTR